MLIRAFSSTVTPCFRLQRRAAGTSRGTCSRPSSSSNTSTYQRKTARSTSSFASCTAYPNKFPSIYSAQRQDLSNKRNPIGTVHARHYSRALGPDPAHDKVRETAIRINEMWKAWEAEEDVFQKRMLGKDLLKLYEALSRHLSSVAKSQDDFEHIAALYGVQVVENYYRLGAIHAQRLHFAEAVDHLRQSCELDPTNFTHHMKYGEVQHAARMYANAVTTYTHILTNMNAEFVKPKEKPQDVPLPDSFKANVFSGLDLRPRKKYPYAKLAEVLFRRAHSHLLLRDAEPALADWKAVIELEPNHRTADSWAWLAYLARVKGKWQQCIDLAKKSLDFDSENLVAHNELSMAHFFLKNDPLMKSSNRHYAILAHERMWGLSNHPEQPDWNREDGRADLDPED